MFSQTVEYALRAVVHLADQSPSPRTTDQIAQGQSAILVVSTETRLPLKRFLEPSFPRLIVLAFQELPAATEIENAGIISTPAHLARPVEPVKVAA